MDAHFHEIMVVDKLGTTNILGADAIHKSFETVLTRAVKELPHWIEEGGDDLLHVEVYGTGSFRAILYTTEAYIEYCESRGQGFVTVDALEAMRKCVQLRAPIIYVEDTA